MSPYFVFKDPFGEKRGKFDYAGLLTRLEKIKMRLDEQADSKGSDLDSSSGTSDNEVENGPSNGPSDGPTDGLSNGAAATSTS